MKSIGIKPSHNRPVLCVTVRYEPEPLPQTALTAAIERLVAAALAGIVEEHHILGPTTVRESDSQQTP